MTKSRDAASLEFLCSTHRKNVDPWLLQWLGAAATKLAASADQLFVLVSACGSVGAAGDGATSDGATSDGAAGDGAAAVIVRCAIIAATTIGTAAAAGAGQTTTTAAAAAAFSSCSPTSVPA